MLSGIYRSYKLEIGSIIRDVRLAYSSYICLQDLQIITSRSICCCTIISGLIQLRNELADYLKSSGDRDASGNFGHLPDPINNIRSCAKCPHLLNCAAYQQFVCFQFPVFSRCFRITLHIGDEYITTKRRGAYSPILLYMYVFAAIMHIIMSLQNC